MRDFTLEILAEIPEAEIMAHGISISPGKPTILAKIGRKPFWGLPGHVVSAMVVFQVVVRPFLEHIAGRNSKYKRDHVCYARLKRNLASKQGRVDYIRARLIDNQAELLAEPILGKSGLIHTMVKADGLIKIGKNTEGLDKGAVVKVDLLV
jgi:molybdopterin molybdotransferase